MSLTVIGVRHHSPACARLVGSTIAALRPAHVLIEGPADMNARIGELLLGHDLPVAVFTSYLDEHRRHGSWAPFCEYSPEWEALRAGRECGAELRFIDLPAWHEAFADRDNRYADAELRYAEAVERLCAEFGVDNSDALWDHVIEMGPAEEVGPRLEAYFDLIRGDSAAGASDTAREAYMARWIRAAQVAAEGRPVVAVVGGFHRPALLRLATGSDSAGTGAGPAGWPEVPAPPAGATAGSYLVPYSFRRLDAFGGYQSGMPSPEFYQRLWESGPEEAARYLITAVAGRLRGRGQPVSTADLIAARTGAQALARLRGHDCPSRVDVLDGLASALVNEALDVPLPWAVRGAVSAGQHPAVVEMTAALSGDRVGRLHPDTPLPPLVHAATADIERYGLDRPGEHTADLTDPHGRTVSRVLHRLRVLEIPGFRRDSGPATGIDPVLREQWTVQRHQHRLAALIEAGGYGPTLEAAATTRIAQRIDEAGGDLGGIADALFDAALCGVTDLGSDVPARLERGIATAGDLSVLGRVLAVTLALWRHDRLLGTAGSVALGVVVAAGARRILWLAEGWHAPGAAADRTRIAAVVAVRDAVLHAAVLGVDRTAAVEIAGRIAADRAAPPDLRGAFYGLGRSLLGDDDPAGLFPEPDEAVRGAFTGGAAGDWLAGLFGVAREHVLSPGGILALLDDLVGGLGADDFLVALPALRQAFEYFPPRERETIAEELLARRGLAGSGRDLLRTTVAPQTVAAGMALDETVEERLVRAGLITMGRTDD
ncbi:hypothetical protein Aph02nite_88160 [Actinoplanes philippinensis]|uniref:Uncharacterized protein n=1 Tax=Actinoplanes philippinensis TaxID=35752 RepID=A0A1I2M3F6_9ACTN|nr:DUF5682 family protein [Actinoplanes philippinensis]GIE82866.1 hypothetical protein Aph02nite_88160 [Actinoplanes philippinensis]SFF84067.1 hypothetical protein SAMN05421541_1259 [Actinoplanes philippinensis]